MRKLFCLVVLLGALVGMSGCWVVHDHGRRGHEYDKHDNGRHGGQQGDHDRR